jgi:putative ABC transport system permease protein
MWRTTLRSLTTRWRRLLVTSVAVVLGIAFLSGTLVLVRTMTTGFSDLVADAYAGTDAVVRSSVVVGLEEVTERGRIDQSLADTVAEVEGVAAVAPRIESSGRIVGADGDQIGGSGLTITANWVDDDRLNPYELAEGRAPSAPGEVVIDRASATEGNLAVGDVTIVRTPDPIEVDVVGLATFGGADSQGSATYAAFTTDYADQVLLPEPGQASSIVVAAEPGIAPDELVRRLDAALPDGVEVITGDALAEEVAELTQGEDNETFQQALLFFTFVALVVAAFNIHNTFSILIAQRTRESALLRALGASRGQVVRSVAAEAVAIGLLGSAAGVVAGFGLAAGLLAVMDRLGLAVPPAGAGLDTLIVGASVAVGVLTTLAASVGPAVSASRIPPLAALRDVAVDRSATSRRRAIVGIILTGAGAGGAVLGATSRTPVITALGGLATLAGVVMLGPVAAPPAAAVLGAPLGRRDVTGVLARRNAARNPRRTAGTATSLMIGVAVVTLFTVLAASLTKSIGDAVDEHFAGELVIIGEGQGGLSPDLYPAVAELPEVAAASPIGGARVRVDGTDSLVSTFDPATIEAVVDLGVEQGSLGDLDSDQVAVSDTYADEHGLAVGDTLTIDYPDATSTQPTIGAIFTNDGLVTSGGVVIPREAYFPHSSRPADSNLLINLADGVTPADGEAAVQAVADHFDAPDVQTNQEYTDAIAGEINVLLTVIYALLVVAIVIGLMGITTTLSLSIHERTREIGLLRAVGQTRRQTHAMIRGEAIIVALFGTIGGLALGLFLARTLTSSLAGEFTINTFAIPILPLAITVALAAAAGVLAATHPARRAARLDVLSAITTD